MTTSAALFSQTSIAMKAGSAKSMGIKELLNQEITEQNAIAVLETVRREFDLGYVIGTYGSSAYTISIIRWKRKGSEIIIQDLIVPGDLVAVAKKIMFIIADYYPYNEKKAG